MKKYLIILAVLTTNISVLGQDLDSVYNNYNSAQTLRTSKGGKLLMAAYGEAHYNQGFGNNTIQNGVVDVHRQVMLFGYKFDNRTSFITEIEVEHINEWFLEQAFLNYEAKPWLNIQAGLVLIPMGIVNEYHEPTTFNGVERPLIDKVMVPSTWRELGAGIVGNVPSKSFRYQLFAVNGPLGWDPNDDSKRLTGKAPIRAGRQKGSQTAMRTPDLSAKINYYGIKGLNIGAALYMGVTESLAFGSVNRDSTAAVASADSSVVGVSMIGLDFRYQNKNFEARGQMIYGNYSNTNQYNEFADADLGTKAYGYYLECGYNIGKMLKLKRKVVPFVRYSQFDTHYETNDELQKNNTYVQDIVTTGISWFVSESFVAKGDYQYIVNGNDVKSHTANFGVGYWFR